MHNSSGRFESRWSAVKVAPSPAVLLQGMEGSSLGVWVAHGEGRAHFPRDASLQAVLKGSQAPLRCAARDALSADHALPAPRALPAPSR